MNVVTSRWVYHIKRKSNGEIARYKARLVARGFSQIEGIDYHETYAPVADMSIIRLLFAYAAAERLHMAQFDIKTAFLYGDLEEEVYLEQPAGYKIDATLVCLLRRSLYGLKQAPRQWNAKFTEFLKKLNLEVSNYDKCVFYRLDPLLIVAIYVDDGIVFARSKNDIDDIIEALKQTFEVHTMELATYLGFQVETDAKGGILLHQTSYILKMLKKFFMADAKPERSPCTTAKLLLDDTPLEESVPYRQAVGSLLYAAISTRIDIAFATNKVGRSVADPKDSDWRAVKRIFRYLAGQPSLGLYYSNESNRGMVAFCDADFAGCETTSRSTTGLIILYGGAPIFWRSARQSLVTTSSSEAEFVSLCSTSKDIVWFRRFAMELNIIRDEPTVLYCDNESAIRLANNESSCKRTRHMSVQAAYPESRSKIINLLLNTNVVKNNWLIS